MGSSAGEVPSGLAAEVPCGVCGGRHAWAACARPGGGRWCPAADLRRRFRDLDARGKRVCEVVVAAPVCVRCAGGRVAALGELRSVEVVDASGAAVQWAGGPRKTEPVALQPGDYITQVRRGERAVPLALELALLAGDAVVLERHDPQLRLRGLEGLGDDQLCRLYLPPRAAGPAPDSGLDVPADPAALRRLRKDRVGDCNHGSAAPCEPCAWFHHSSGLGCAYGAECVYCHLCPPGEMKRQRLAAKSERVKMQQALEQIGAPEPDARAGPAADAPHAGPRPEIHAATKKKKPKKKKAGLALRCGSTYARRVDDAVLPQSYARPAPAGGARAPSPLQLATQLAFLQGQMVGLQLAGAADAWLPPLIPGTLGPAMP